MLSPVSSNLRNSRYSLDYIRLGELRFAYLVTWFVIRNHQPPDPRLFEPGLWCSSPVLLDELLERFARDLADGLAFRTSSRCRPLVEVERGAKVQTRRLTAATRERPTPHASAAGQG